MTGEIAKARRAAATMKGRVVRAVGSTVAAGRRPRKAVRYRPAATTVITVNWNSLSFLKPMLAAVETLSPAGTEIVVVDNASKDGSPGYLAGRSGVRVVHLPINVGHGIALDLVVPQVRTEYVAILDVDAFPVSPTWLQSSIAALMDGAQVAGAHLHRNFVHPSFLVTRSAVVHEYGLTFRPVGSLAGLERSAPLFMDVGEALSQRLQIKFGGGQALHFFEPTSVKGPGLAGAVFGGLVYHNLYSTQGIHKNDAVDRFNEAFNRHHPNLVIV